MGQEGGGNGGSRKDWDRDWDRDRDRNRNRDRDRDRTHGNPNYHQNPRDHLNSGRNTGARRDRTYRGDDRDRRDAFPNNRNVRRMPGNEEHRDNNRYTSNNGGMSRAHGRDEDPTRSRSHHGPTVERNDRQRMMRGTEDHISREDDLDRGRRRRRESFDRYRDGGREWDRDRDRERDRGLYSEMEFSRGRRSSHNYHPQKRQRRSFFPSRFETSSQGYEFDTLNGFFHHVETDFFYDPKSKLYFSREEKVYYKYEENKNVDDDSSDKRKEEVEEPSLVKKNSFDDKDNNETKKKAEEQFLTEEDTTELKDNSNMKKKEDEEPSAVKKGTQNAKDDKDLKKEEAQVPSLTQKDTQDIKDVVLKNEMKGNDGKVKEEEGKQDVRKQSISSSRGRFVKVNQEEAKSKMKIIDNSLNSNDVDEGQNLIVQALQGDNKNCNTSKKKKISICIKQKKPLGKSKKKALLKLKQKEEKEEKVVSSQDAEKISQSEKTHQANMDLWSQREKEKSEGTESGLDGGTTLGETGTINSKVRSGPRKIRKTKTGKPVCMLCKRKFVNVEKLLRHEKLSQLHKNNLKKNGGSNNDPGKYVDRALQRRAMYEADPQNAAIIDASQIIKAPSLDHARDVDITEVSKPEDNLGETNKGNQLLRKLMEKSNAIGKENNDSKKQTNENLQKDWERIENLASKTKNRRY